MAIAPRFVSEAQVEKWNNRPLHYMGDIDKQTDQHHTNILNVLKYINRLIISLRYKNTDKKTVSVPLFNYNLDCFIDIILNLAEYNFVHINTIYENMGLSQYLKSNRKLITIDNGIELIQTFVNEPSIQFGDNNIYDISYVFQPYNDIFSSIPNFKNFLINTSKQLKRHIKSYLILFMLDDKELNWESYCSIKKGGDITYIINDNILGYNGHINIIPDDEIMRLATENGFNYVDPTDLLESGIINFKKSFGGEIKLSDIVGEILTLNGIPKNSNYNDYLGLFKIKLFEYNGTINETVAISNIPAFSGGGMVRHQFNSNTYEKEFVYITDKEDECYHYLSNKRSYYPIDVVSDPDTDLAIIFGKGLDQKSFSNMFKYLFNTIKQGIYVKIYKGSLVCFEPFINAKLEVPIFKNEIKINHNVINGGFSEIFTKLFSDNSHQTWSTMEWYYENSILNKYKEYDYWSENQLYILKLLLKNLCQNNTFDDCEFFINRDKYPCLKNTYKRNSLPILSFCSSNAFKDIAIPSTVDWMLCYNNIEILPWENRIDMVYFRGIMPSDIVTENFEQRNLLMDISRNYETNDNFYIKFMSKNLLIPGQTTMGSGTNEEQFNIKELLRYKYLIAIDSYSACCELSLFLKIGALILRVKSINNYKLWYDDYLIPYDKEINNYKEANYIEIASDMHNLEEWSEWLNRHKKQGKEIANNAYNLGQQLF